LNEKSQLELTFRHNTLSSGLSLWLETANKQRIYLALSSTNTQWTRLTLPLQQYAGKSIQRIGLSVISDGSNAVSTNIGQLAIN
jgi:endo-beta-N-acetylglucosaminidase D